MYPDIFTSLVGAPRMLSEDCLLKRHKTKCHSRGDVKLE